jgi:hypothetical protein
VEYFAEKHGIDRIIPVIIAGKVNGGDEECFCPALKKYDIPLFGILANSTAVIKSGRVVISSENPTLFDFICTDTHSRELARAIYDVMGRRMKIAVAKNEKPKENLSPLEDLKNKINRFNNN